MSSKGFLVYTGNRDTTSFSLPWTKGHKVPLEVISKNYGYKSGDSECGEVFLGWLQNTIADKPFQIELTAGTQEQATNNSSGFTSLESGQVVTSSSSEQAKAKLTQLSREQVSEEAMSGTIIEDNTSIKEMTTTNRAKRRKNSVSEMKESMKQESQPMTGDDLDAQADLDYRNDTIGEARKENSVVATPPVSNTSPSKSEVVSDVFMADPSPSLQPAGKVSRGDDEIVTTKQTLSNVTPVNTSTEVLTGDHFVSDAEQASSPISPVEATAFGGKKVPVSKGSPQAQEVSVDQIIRASDMNSAVSAIEGCMNRSTLNTAKNMIRNGAVLDGAQKLLDKIETRSQFLKSRGF